MFQLFGNASSSPSAPVVRRALLSPRPPGRACRTGLSLGGQNRWVETTSQRSGVPDRGVGLQPQLQRESLAVSAADRKLPEHALLQPAASPEGRATSTGSDTVAASMTSLASVL